MWICIQSNLVIRKILIRNKLVRGVITTKATKAAALVDFWDHNKWPKQHGRFEEQMSLFFYQAKNSLNILGLLCRFEEINIFIILPSKETPWIYWVFFWGTEKKLWFYHAKRLLEFTGSSLRNWKHKYFYYFTKHI